MSVPTFEQHTDNFLMTSLFDFLRYKLKKLKIVLGYPFETFLIIIIAHSFFIQ